ncbi:MAG: NAD-dependent epimerase/dehydratase family protein [Defluviitaleaceae bacterium]|nr:NAD-dependent epimerase/dehydratase family protein [Defluviitaleaceae bacterium]
MNVLVIGGTGVISTAIVDRLAEVDNEVTVFNRGTRDARYKAEVKEITGDKNNVPEFTKHMKANKFDAVIDMISYTWEDAAITLDAFWSLADTPHFIFTSTCATYKRPIRAAAVTEDFPRWTDDTFYPYGYHKARMEDYLLKRAEDDGIKVTIIRPSLTYGIGSKNIGVLRNNYGIIERIKQNKPVIVFGDGTNPWEFTFAPDIAKAYAGVVCREHCFGQIYHATSGDVRIWDDLYLEFGKIIGIEPKILHVSTEMLMEAEHDRLLHVYQEKMSSGVFDNSKIKRDVPEYECDYTLDKTLRAIYDWYTTDAKARVIDKNLDAIEDALVEKYAKCAEILRNN